VNGLSQSQLPPPPQSIEQKDPNYGKQVILTPNPLITPLEKNVPLTELHAGQRLYKIPGRVATEGKQVATLVLNADPSKGPFMCDFKMGEFELRLLAVRVESVPGDTRITCQIGHPATNRVKDVYLRVFQSETRHKFFELRPADNQLNTDKQRPPAAPRVLTAYFVSIDSIVLDVRNGLWKKIVLSLVQVSFMPRPQQQQVQYQGQQQQFSNRPPQANYQSTNYQQVQGGQLGFQFTQSYPANAGGGGGGGGYGNSYGGASGGNQRRSGNQQRQQYGY